MNDNDCHHKIVDFLKENDVSFDVIDTIMPNMNQKDIDHILHDCAIMHLVTSDINKFIDRGFIIDDNILFSTLRASIYFMKNDYLFNFVLGSHNKEIMMKLFLLNFINTTRYLSDRGFVFGDDFKKDLSFCPSVMEALKVSRTEVIIYRVRSFFSSMILIYEKNKKMCHMKIQPTDYYYVCCFIIFLTVNIIVRFI